MSLFITKLLADPMTCFSWVIIVTFSICLHEYFHAAAALRMGDDTAARAGHLSLNPRVQMGWASVIMLARIGIAWGAVPVNAGRLRTRGAAALVSFAGPAANLLLCAIFALLAVVSVLVAVSSEALLIPATFFRLASLANGVLFLFNMLPVPMFDGWTVFALFFPRLNRLGAQSAQATSWIFLLVVFMTPIGQLIWHWGEALAVGGMAGWTMLFRLIL